MAKKESRIIYPGFLSKEENNEKLKALLCTDFIKFNIIQLLCIFHNFITYITVFD
jgi:hypothetical protein